MKIALEDINIRTYYKRGDIGYITFMHGRTYDFGPFFEVYVAETLANFYRELNTANERVWIAEYHDEIIGTIALKNTNHMAQLRYFLIKPTYRGIGLGKKLLDLFMAFMKDCGYVSSFLLTEENLKTAAHLYGKYGYQYISSSETSFGLVERRYEMKL